MKRNSMVAAVIAMMLTVAIADAQTNVKSGFNLFSAEQDVQIGQESAQAAEQQLPILNDNTVNTYINNLGQRLAKNAGGPQFPYRFRVVNASDINAFALPGGFIYMNRGVLDQARNEGELAGVIAHEISHVSLRHGTHQASKAYLAQAGISILGGLLGGKVGEGTANIINAVGGFGMNALFLKYSRDLETQADIRGAQILAASGYTPADMVSFFQTLEKVDTAKKTTWLSDHPAPPDRISRIQKEATALNVSQTPTQNVAQLQSVQAQMRRLGAAPTMQQIAQGTVPQSSSTPQTQQQQQQERRQRRRSTQSGTADVNVPAPSTTFRTFTSPTRMYQISYPSNWKVYKEAGTGVTFAPPGGVGEANGQTDIVFGAIVNHYAPFNSAQASRFRGTTTQRMATLEDATNDLLGALQQSSPYLQLISNSGQRITMANGSAIAASLRGVDPATNINERVTVVTRQLADGHLLYLLFIVPEREATQYAGVLNEMVNSMRIAEGAAH